MLSICLTGRREGLVDYQVVHSELLLRHWASMSAQREVRIDTALKVAMYNPIAQSNVLMHLCRIFVIFVANIFGIYYCISGSVYHCNENGKAQKCFTTDSCIQRLMIMESKNILVTVTVNLTLAQHSISPSGDLKEILKVS